jgi:hypothetical protein
VRSRPSQLFAEVPPAKEEPFSTPRSWHAVSDALHAFGDDIAADHLDAVMFGSLARDHAVGFKAFLKQIRNRFSVHKILKGEEPWGGGGGGAGAAAGAGGGKTATWPTS